MAVQVLAARASLERHAGAAAKAGRYRTSTKADRNSDGQLRADAGRLAKLLLEEY